MDAACACGCQLLQPVGQIIAAANHSCFAATSASVPVTWRITADPGRVVQLTYRLLTARRRHDTPTDPSPYVTALTDRTLRPRCCCRLGSHFKRPSRASVDLQLVLLRTVYSQAQGCMCSALQLGGDLVQPWLMSKHDVIHKTGSK